jgi:hypothetical protein
VNTAVEYFEANMNKFERWIIKRAIAKEVRQGFSHPDRITALYRMIRVACEREFFEDNVPTLNSSLTEWFNASLRKLSK